MEHRTYKRDGSPQPGKFNNRKLYVVRNINRSELTEAANDVVPRWQKVLLDTLQLTSNDHMRTAIKIKARRSENWSEDHHRPQILIDQHYMDEIWKPSKKEGSTTSHSKSLFARSSSIKSSSSKSLFTRSSSTRSSSSKSPLLRSFSQKGSSPKCPLPRSFSQKSSSNSISRKCSSLAKEQKARFYIMRRCVAMLVCWHKHGDS
ncbi:small polypeptide DEVIL 13 [Alnus glutinosa]|uniref:small polypeptide DEVIL 13 n=1 Tax=Alnus glutinosa TaxID=3517 RepID=UPI002D77EDA4|nr:small polypeptide DEVIL 13 [Alnus glutinosa]XP_062172601.1 small polypeptide DEVIL 13 [Alnus glutinosa]